MTNVLESVIVIVAILSAIALPIGLGIYFSLRTEGYKHQERMEMIKQGLMPPLDEKIISNRLKSLKNAIVLIGLGIGAGIGVLIVKTLNIQEDEAIWAVGPSVLLFLGISHLVYFFLAKKYTQNQVD